MNTLLAVQHRLPSIRWLFREVESRYLVDYSALVTKDYSNIDFPLSLIGVKEFESIDLALKSLHSNPIIALDEGGVIHSSTASVNRTVLAGVEQTTFGYRNEWKYPTVLVCRSAAKLIFESQIIARGILRKLNSTGALGNKRLGIIGLGALGAALSRSLLSQGHTIFAAEISSEVPDDLASVLVPLSQLISECDVILGCTGKDALAGVEWSEYSGSRCFISCSSSNIEFFSLMACATQPTKFGTLRGVIGRMNFEILNGGYPVNFDRQREWEMFNEIILTRKLVLAGLVQAASLIGSRPRGVMLNPGEQMRIVNDWLMNVPDRKSLMVPDRLDEDFFIAHSQGEWGEDVGKYTLDATTPLALFKMRGHRSPYEIDVVGFTLKVLPGVWSPAYDWSGAYHVENLPDLTDKSILEIGCGTGLISIGAAYKGANRIVAVDVNPSAVTNTRVNFEMNGCQACDVFESDLFTSVTESFDVIIWNAPYHGVKPSDMLERACADENYHDMRAFFKRASSYLNSNGMIILGFSQSGDLDLIHRLIEENQLRIKRSLSEWRNGYNCMIFELLRN